MGALHSSSVVGVLKERLSMLQELEALETRTNGATDGETGLYADHGRPPHRKAGSTLERGI